jgi:hypothetical protein
VSDPEEPFGPARPDAGTRVRRAGAALIAQIRALLVPDRGVPALVAPGRGRLAMIIVVASALSAAAAVSARIDLAPDVRAENAGGPAGGPPGAGPPGEDKTDRDIAEEIEKRTAIVQVKAWLGAGLKTPGLIILLAVGLFLLGRYVGGKPTFQRAMAAASVGALPWAIRSLIEAAAVWRQDAVRPGDLDDLVAGAIPLATNNPLLSRLLASADLFSLWSLVLCGFGLAAAAGISRTRSFIAVSIGFVLVLFLKSLGAP